MTLRLQCAYPTAIFARDTIGFPRGGGAFVNPMLSLANVATRHVRCGSPEANLAREALRFPNRERPWITGPMLANQAALHLVTQQSPCQPQVNPTELSKSFTEG